MISIEKTILWAKKLRFLIVAIVIIGLIFGISLWRKNNSQQEYQTTKVTRDNIVSTVSESGNLIAEGQANIGSPIEGVVENIFVKNGSYVYAGQALFSVKSMATDAEKLAAQSAYLNAKNNTISAEQNKNYFLSQISLAKKQLADAQNIYNTVSRGTLLGTVNPSTLAKYTRYDLESAKAMLEHSQQNLSIAEQKYTSADNSIEAAEIAEEAARLNFNDKNVLLVKSPSFGTVHNISLNPGDKISPSNLSSSPVLIIARNNNLTFKTQINENDIPKIKIGQEAIIKIDAIKEKDFSAKVKNIDTVGTDISGVVSFNVYFSIDHLEQNMRSNMSGTVEIMIEKRENALSVPNNAIKSYQNGKALQILSEDKKELKYVQVKTGIKGNEKTEIIEGIEENAEIVINDSSNKFKSSLFGGR